MDPVKRELILFLIEAELHLPTPERLDEKFKPAETEEIEKIVRSVLKDPASEEKIVRIVRNVLVQLYKCFYNRRSFWSSSLNANPD